ncbi:MAG TPA: DNA polymerase III subunit delta' [Actinomycetota bacterium]|nr:DNA polymerase III subunit delta' [Actinomycetota bacterium]
MSVWENLGGTPAATWLAGQIAAGEVPHAWAFLGPAGSGKKPTAVAMAAALNCPREPLVGCGVCPTCSRVLRGRHPDVHHIVPEGPLIPVDVVRELVVPEAARSPFEGIYKVFVIEEADRMNEPAQNALLKTLEEPQPDTVFVLISEHEEEILETVRSRCRIVRLEPLPEQRVIEILTAEGADEGEAVLAARISDGDVTRARAVIGDGATRERRALWSTIPRRLAAPTDALAAATEIVAEVKETLKAREAEQKEEVVELAEAMGEGRGTRAPQTALAKRHRRELRRLEELILGEALQTLASFYRDVLVMRAGGSDSVVNIDLVEEISLRASEGGADDAALVRVVERFLEARGSLVHNANQALALEGALLEAVRLAPNSVS